MGCDREALFTIKLKQDRQREFNARGASPTKKKVPGAKSEKSVATQLNEFKQQAEKLFGKDNSFSTAAKQKVDENKREDFEKKPLTVQTTIAERKLERCMKAEEAEKEKLKMKQDDLEKLKLEIADQKKKIAEAAEATAEASKETESLHNKALVSLRAARGNGGETSIAGLVGGRFGDKILESAGFK